MLRSWSSGEPTSQLDILLIEDNQDDIAYLEHLASKIREPVRLATATDGEQALDYLSRRCDDARRRGEPPPQLILLDVGLPGISGIEVLQRIKANQELADTPVIILTGEEDERIIRDGQVAGAHSHIAKPMSRQEFTWIVNSLQSYRKRIGSLAR